MVQLAPSVREGGGGITSGKFLSWNNWICTSFAPTKDISYKGDLRQSETEAESEN